MRSTRLCRQAHTCGLTYWTVGIPASWRLRARRRFVSGASIPTNTSGRASMKARRKRRNSRKSRGSSRRISNNPMTASDSDGSQTSQPAARILGPATPKNCAVGSSRRSASISAAPSVSPDASPATSPTRSGAVMALLANEAARAAFDEIDERPDLGLRCGRALEFLQRRLELQPGTIQHAIGAPDVADLLLGEPAPFEPLRVHAVRSRGPADRHDVRRHIARHHGVVREKTVIADLGELVHGRESPHDHPVAELDVAAQGGAIRKHDLIAEPAVVRHVRIGHQQVVVADDGDAVAGYGAAIHGYRLAKDVAVADLEPRRLR